VILDALALLVANVCLLLAGLGVLRLVSGGRLPGGSWSRLGLAYVVGVATVGSLAPLLLVAGLDLTLPEILVMCGVLFLLGYARGRGSVEPAPASSPRVPGVLAACAGLTAAFLVLLAVDLAFQPLYKPDAWSQWAAKARAIVLLGGLDPRVFASSLYGGFNLDYPLLVPALEAIDFRFMGFNTRILHLQFWLLLVGFVLALQALARDRVPRAVVWPIICAIVFAPTVAIQTASAYADLPLAVFFSLAGVCAWRWLSDRDAASLALLSLFATAAAATKIEGMPFAASLLLVTGLLAARRSGRLAGAAVLAAALVALVAIVPWRVWVAEHGVHSSFSIANAFSPEFLGPRSGRLPTIVVELAENVLDPAAWLLILPLALAAAVLVFRYGSERESGVLMLATFALSMAGLVWIYWSTRLPLDYHLETSSKRVVLAPVLFCAALAPFLLAEILRQTTQSHSPEAAGPVWTNLGVDSLGQDPRRAERRKAPTLPGPVEQIALAEDDPPEP